MVISGTLGAISESPIFDTLVSSFVAFTHHRSIPCPSFDGVGTLCLNPIADPVCRDRCEIWLHQHHRSRLSKPPISVLSTHQPSVRCDDIRVREAALQLPFCLWRQPGRLADIPREMLQLTCPREFGPWILSPDLRNIDCVS